MKNIQRIYQNTCKLPLPSEDEKCPLEGDIVRKKHDSYMGIGPGHTNRYGHNIMNADLRDNHTTATVWRIRLFRQTKAKRERCKNKEQKL